LCFSIALLSLLLSTPAHAQRTRVYIVIVDGLDAAAVSEASTPTLWRLAHGGSEPATFYPHGRAVMPAVTTTNHAAILTGSYAAAHGIVANQLWDRITDHKLVSSADACNLEMETLFTAIERDRPALTTAGLFGKARLTALFDACPGRQMRPDILWGDDATANETFEPDRGFASDRRTMDEALRTVTQRDPDLLVVALPDVDRTAHLLGPAAPESLRAVRNADREIQRLIDSARQRDTWKDTILMITADHGFRALEPDRSSGPPYPLIVFTQTLARAGIHGVRVVTSGGSALLLLPGHAPDTLDADTATKLAHIRTLALSHPGIAEAWYRLSNPADGGDLFTIAHAHPEWTLSHPRSGELILVADAAHTFADAAASPNVTGDHGGPTSLSIPILITGGDRRLRPQTAAPHTPTAENPDLGVTAAWLLGVSAPRPLAGAAAPRTTLGRVLREAFTGNEDARP
jgi:hypothetical protein